MAWIVGDRKSPSTNNVPPTGTGQAGGQMRGHGGFSFAIAGTGDHDDLGGIGPRLLQQNGAEVIDRFRQNALHRRGAVQALGSGKRFQIRYGSQHTQSGATAEFAAAVKTVGFVLEADDGAGTQHKSRYTGEQRHDHSKHLAGGVGHAGLFQGRHAAGISRANFTSRKSSARLSRERERPWISLSRLSSSPLALPRADTSVSRLSSDFMSAS